MPNDALLMSFFPHMHLRGKTFEYNLVAPHGRVQTLLRIPKYDFYWQLSYRLATPLPLKAGTVLQAVATFDNSSANVHNPDPSAKGEVGRADLVGDDGGVFRCGGGSWGRQGEFFQTGALRLHQ